MKRRKLYQEAVRDFFGNAKFGERVLLKYLLKRNKPEITEEEKEAVWYIQKNISDSAYREGLRVGS